MHHEHKEHRRRVSVRAERRRGHCRSLYIELRLPTAYFANTAPAFCVLWKARKARLMIRRPTSKRTADDETADDERAYGTDGYWQRRYTALAQGSGLGASAAGVEEDVTYATQARTPDSQTGLLLTRMTSYWTGTSGCLAGSS